MIRKQLVTYSRKVLVALLTVFLLSGCNEPKLTTLPDDGVILAFGDSLTVGIGSSQAHSYPSVLANLTGLEVINSGVSGETTVQGLQRLPQVLEETDIDLLILMEGGNDILRNKNLLETKANLTAMIKLARSQSIPVVLIGIPEKKLFSNSAPFYDALADEFELVFDRELVSTLLHTRAYKSDAIHLNKKGYRKMAESIFELLKDNGALP